MLREYLKINRNVLIAAATSTVFAAVISQALVDQENYLNTTYTTIADYVIYFSVFSGLFYLDNRKRYKLESGKTDTARLRHEIIRLITALGVAQVAYTISRWVIQYYLLEIGYDPYITSIIAQVTSTGIFMIVMNLSMLITRLYKDD